VASKPGQGACGSDGHAGVLQAMRPGLARAFPTWFDMTYFSEGAQLRNTLGLTRLA
jgi:hypothetical protein